MKRVVVLGPGGAGKSVFASHLARVSGLPLIELDQLLWDADLTPKSREEFVKLQHDLAAGERWVMDGDLGPYDAVEVRLERADTIVVLDFPTWRCVFRSLRRSRQRRDFWRWLLTWRRRYRPQLMKSIDTHGGGAQLHTPRNPRDLGRLATELEDKATPH